MDIYSTLGKHTIFAWSKTMKIIKGYQYRIYPNKEQCSMITQIIGCYRYVYNYFLEVRTRAYNEKKIAISLNETRNMLTELKKVMKSFIM